MAAFETWALPRTIAAGKRYLGCEVSTGREDDRAKSIAPHTLGDGHTKRRRDPVRHRRLDLAGAGARRPDPAVWPLRGGLRILCGVRRLRRPAREQALVAAAHRWNRRHRRRLHDPHQDGTDGPHPPPSGRLLAPGHRPYLEW